MEINAFINLWQSADETIPIQTSGSTGIPKIFLAQKKHMVNSARRTCDFLGLKSGDVALLCLPLDYIAGKMMVVRSLVRDLRLVTVKPTSHPLVAVNARIDFAAMIPLQLHATLTDANETQKLRNIRQLIIGGGAIDTEDEKKIKDFPHDIWSTYGMTETLSHIAMRKVNGPDADEWYTPLSGVTLTTDAEHCLIIDAPEICSQTLRTNDIVRLRTNACGIRQFKILGRKDNVINSGSIKIQIEDIEQRLKPHLDRPFMISKRKDAAFGEIMVLLTQDTDIPHVKTICQSRLAPHYRPKVYLSVRTLPYTANGKPARAQAEEIAQSSL